MPYCVIQDVRDEGFLDPPFTDARVQKAIDNATAFIDAMTARWFEPRSLTFDVTWRGSQDIIPEPEIPIISITEVRFVNTDGTLSNPLDADDFTVFNRHVRQGLLAPDDREDPKIAFEFIRPGIVVPRPRPRLVQELLSRRVQNIRLVGKFGYTEPDFGVAFPQDGITPPLIARACLVLATKQLAKLAEQDALDAALSGGRLMRVATRDQSITLQPDIRVERGAEFSGDPEVDLIIARYRLPPRVEAV